MDNKEIDSVLYVDVQVPGIWRDQSRSSNAKDPATVFLPPCTVSCPVCEIPPIIQARRRVPPGTLCVAVTDRGL